MSGVTSSGRSTTGVFHRPTDLPTGLDDRFRLRTHLLQIPPDGATPALGRFRELHACILSGSMTPEVGVANQALIPQSFNSSNGGPVAGHSRQWHNQATAGRTPKPRKRWARGIVMDSNSRVVRMVIGSAAAITMTISGAAIAGGVAEASSSPPDPAVTCTLGATITIDHSGLSKAGSIGPDRAGSWSISPLTLGGGGCSGSGNGSLVAMNGARCDKYTPGLPASNPACEPGMFGINSWANYNSDSAMAFGHSYKKSVFQLDVNGINYLGSRPTMHESAIPAGGICGSSEEGFQLTALPRAPRADRAQTITVTACLGAVTGTGLTSSTFLGASFDQNGAVVTIQVDPMTSSVHIG
jgi:hypothetical protein